MRRDVERLFAEPFEPLWMKRQREAEALNLCHVARAKRRPRLKDRVEQQWDDNARASHAKILATHYVPRIPLK